MRLGLLRSRVRNSPLPKAPAIGTTVGPGIVTRHVAKSQTVVVPHFELGRSDPCIDEAHAWSTLRTHALFRHGWEDDNRRLGTPEHLPKAYVPGTDVFDGV